MIRKLIIALPLASTALLVGCASVPAPEQLVDGRSYRVSMARQFDGFERTYRVHVPSGYRASEPTPLVVVLHGAFSTSAEMELHTGFSDLADREGFAVAYPDGIGILGLLQHWNAGHCCGKAAADGIDDVGFVAAVIEDVRRYLNIDAGRIYMAGFSNGAMLTHRFAAERPAMLAAAAPLAGAIGSRDGDGSEWTIPVPPSGVPMIMFHGRRDERIPYGSPGTGVGAGGRDFATVAATSRFWSTNNGCSRHRREQSGAFPGVTVDTWTDCDQNAEVQLFTLRDWGHRWPGPFFTGQAGRQGSLYGFDAAEIIWAFFQRHERPEGGTLSS